MRTIRHLALLLFTVLAAPGQGLINFDNGISGVVQAPIYGADIVNPSLQTNRNTPAVIPTGDPSFTGILLAGSGYTAELWGGPLGSAEDSLTPLGTTTFRTGPSAGYIVPVQVPILSAPVGERATFQVRVWDNLGGTVTSWDQAKSGYFGPFGSSALFSPPEIIGANPLNLVGLTSFNLVAVPEPSVVALAVLGSALLTQHRRHSKRRRISPR